MILCDDIFMCVYVCVYVYIYVCIYKRENIHKTKSNNKNIMVRCNI